MEVMVLVYLFFIFVSIYFSFLFLILYFSNKNLMMEDMTAKNIPRLSVLIPAWDIEGLIGKAIEGIKKVDYPKDKLEIIVIDRESKDKTAEIARSYGVRVLNMKRNKSTINHKADVLNFGLKHAKGQIIAVVDADSRPARDSFLKMVSKFEDKNVGAVTSAVLVKNQEKWIEKMQEVEYTIIAWARKLLEFLGCVYVTPGALSMYKTRYSREIGGFDNKNLTEDIDIAWRMLKKGYIIKVALSAKVLTIVPSTIKMWWKQRLRWNIGGLQTAIKHSDLFGKKSYGLLGLFVTPFFISSFVLSIAGFGVFLYYTIKQLSGFIFFSLYSKNADIPTIQLNYLNLIPTVFTFFIIALFIITVIYVICGLVTMEPKKMSLKRLLNVEIYLLFYLVCAPINLLQSVWLMAIKKFEW